MEQLPGVIDANLIFTNGQLKVNTEPDKFNPEQVIKTVRQLGYSITIMDESTLSTITRATPQELLVKNPYFLPGAVAGIMLVVGLALLLFRADYPYINTIFIIGILLGLILPAKNGFTTLIKVKQLDMNALMTIAVLGAMFIGELQEALAVVFLFAAGNFLQVYTFDKTRLSIRGLMEMTPQEASVITDEGVITKLVSDLQIGDIVMVKPGETIAADGTVRAGNSSVNQAPITGESVPVFKDIGSQVFAGTMNEYGSLEVRVDKLSKDSTLSKIIHMVEEAQGQRAPSQQLIDKFANVYTPIVILLALFIAILPPLLFNQPSDKWLYQAFAVLLVACPCALVISTPVSIVSAIGNAAKNGVLIKGGAYLEELGRLSAIAFDKTGTLTKGKPEVTDVIGLKLADQELLDLATLIESRSEHPIAQAIINYNQIINSNNNITEFQAVPGKGAKAVINEELYYLGSPRFLKENNIDLSASQDTIDNISGAGKTVVVLGNSQEALGLIAIFDVLRDESADTITELKKSGIKHVIMLTGDNQQVAQSIADHIKADAFAAELLPEDKAYAMNDLLEQYNKVAMVGDGINDAPALANSTVGIAMGGAGATGTALETADIALMSDNLSKLPFAIRLSRNTVRIIKQNIVISLLIKGIILLLVIPGLLTMWLAVIADVGTSMLVTLNGMRLLWSGKE